MRTYGRIDGVWVEVDTDANGYNDAVYLTTLVQCLKLAPGESPFYADYGIPAQKSVIQQIFPDFYVTRTQSQFAQYFTSLTISRTTDTTPTYNLSVLTNDGSSILASVAI